MDPHNTASFSFSSSFLSFASLPILSIICSYH
jgi:hypothetical protein